MDALVIPVKRLDAAKLRLAAALGPAGRRRLGLTMLADVLRATERWPLRLVVTADSDAEAVGLAFGCALVADPGEGLNSAVTAATRRAEREGATALLVLPSDVPLVRPEDVIALFCIDAGVVVAVSRDGGTNALLRRPPSVIEPAFGPGSATAHERAGLEAGVQVRSVVLPSLALDVDDASDLERLARAPDDLESVRVARELVAQKQRRRSLPAAGDAHGG